MDIEKLAKDWIQYQLLFNTTVDKGLLEDSVFQINDLIFENPKVCWEVILKILDKTDDELVLANLSAGPLESLLGHNGQRVIIWVEEEAAKNPKFKELLKGVWRNTMSGDIWHRVQTASK